MAVSARLKMKNGVFILGVGGRTLVRIKARTKSFLCILHSPVCVEINSEPTAIQGSHSLNTKLLKAPHGSALALNTEDVGEMFPADVCHCSGGGARDGEWLGLSVRP